MAYDKNGFLPLRYNEALQLIQDTQNELLENPLTYANNKIGYQINASYARAYDLLAQAVEAAFDNLKLGSAEDQELEEIGRLRNVFRNRATRSSTSTLKLTGNSNLVVPAGTLFGSSALPVQVYIPSSVTLNALNCISASVETASNFIGVEYGIVVNGETYSYTPIVGDVVEDIHNGIIAQVNADNSKTFTISDVAISSQKRRLDIVTEDNKPLSVATITTKMQVTNVSVFAFAEASETGAVSVPATFINTILRPINGLNEVVNLETFVLGREKETDSEYRLRIAAGNIGDSTGTADTIEQALLTNVSGVTLARVFENTNTFPTDSEGRPRGSYEVLVDGTASDASIAAEIWRTKPCGMETFGAISLVTPSSSGQPKIVQFSRPIEIPIIVDVTYTLYPELVFPDDGPATIQQAVADYINNLPIGRDLFANTLYGPIYSAVQGLQITGIFIRKKDGSTGITLEIPIGDKEFASCLTTDVNIQES